MEHSSLRFKHKLAIAALAATLAATPVIPGYSALFGESIIPTAHAATATAAAAPTIKLVSETPVTAGATLRKYVWNSTRSNKPVQTNANVLVIDLHNPHVQLDVMTGKQDQFTTRQSVRGMANETGAVAGVNGDYYNVSGEGAPIGGVISEGELLSSPSYLSGMYAFALTKDRQPIIDTFTFSGTISSEGGINQYPLAGMNKTTYWTDPAKIHSHQDALYIYTSDWGSKSRANDGATVPTEVLVVDRKVVQIAADSTLDMLVPEDGYILRASGKAATFIKEAFKPGDSIYADYALRPVDQSKTYDTSSFQMMIGGHTILVDNGATTAYSRDVSSLGGNRSRTGLGYSKDGRYIYMITVDNSGDSKGMNLSEFQKFMVSLGVWKGLNLDGGGSTQLVSRPLGETATVNTNQMENSTARLVVNGLGVYTTAPQGDLLGLFIQSEAAMFLGEKKTLRLKAYDQYYNPLAVDSNSVKWTASSNIGHFNGAEFTALQAGTLTVTADGGNQAKQTKDIDIVGRYDIDSMKFETEDFIVAEGDRYELPVVVVTVKGVKRTIPTELLSWEFIGFEGLVKTGDQAVTVTNVTTDDGYARIIARYDGMSAMLTRSLGTDKLFADFNAIQTPVVTSVTPLEVSATINQVTGLIPGEPDNAALFFAYNFKEGTGTKAAYAAFGADGNGLAIEGQPDRMKMNVLGDGSLNWLRAEFIDANQKSYLVDVANPVDWYGWQTESVDLSSYKMSYPITLKRVYVASPEQGQDEREPIGSIGIDDIAFTYKGEIPVAPKSKVEMAVGRTSLTVNGITSKLEQAPITENNSTLIPVRFFVDAMGGEIKWDAKEKRVSVIRDGHLIEMWIGDKMVVVDGKLIESPVAPKLSNGRTLLPLRLISEALGWKVGYEEKTKSITLE
jgi:exopolysaccharide biosynthesis protein